MVSSIFYHLVTTFLNFLLLSLQFSKPIQLNLMLRLIMFSLGLILIKSLIEEEALQANYLDLLSFLPILLVLVPISVQLGSSLNILIKYQRKFVFCVIQSN